MRVVNIAAVLKNITGFVPGNSKRIEERQNDVWHWFKHCFGFLGDMPHVLTTDEYLKIGRELALKAAQNKPGTYTKLRDDDILIYWEPGPERRGLFMVVRPAGLHSGEIATLFSPDEGKRCYDIQGPLIRTLH